MSQQSVRQAARRSALDAQAVLRKERTERFGYPPVHRLQPMERRFGLRDLYLRRGEAPAQGLLRKMAGEERLARALLPSHGLEHRTSATSVARGASSST
jgi:hypothetical protein